MTASAIAPRVHFSRRSMRSVETVCVLQSAFTWHVYADQINEMDAELSLSFLRVRGRGSGFSFQCYPWEICLLRKERHCNTGGN